jgi:hypothetical protein
MSMQAYYSISPSGWCENNPIRYLDLTGKSTHINEDGDVWCVNLSGNQLKNVPNLILKLLGA